MKPAFMPNLQPFQLRQDAKGRRTRRSRSESELDDKLSYGNAAWLKNKKIPRIRVAWNSTSNHWDSYCNSSCGGESGRTTRGHQRRVKFSDGKTSDSWGYCIKHQPQNPNGKQGRMVLLTRERDFCEVLGNQYCKSCRKEGLRMECIDDFESTYLDTKSHHEKRSFTPFSDIVLCRNPAIPHSESRGLFNRLHELNSCSPEYYINPVDGINCCVDQPISSCSPTDANMADSEDSELFENTTPQTSALHYSGREKESFQDGEEEGMHFEKSTKNNLELEKSEEKSSQTFARKTSSFRSAAKAVAIATTRDPVRKSNTFLPELQLREVRAKMKQILSSSIDSNEENWAGMCSNKKEGSFLQMAIEPPQITVDFAMGIFDPKKRQLRKKINYAAVVPAEDL